MADWGNYGGNNDGYRIGDIIGKLAELRSFW